MNRNTLANALPIVAAAYGRKFGVQVQVGGSRACTDGQTIRIPEIGDDPIAKTLAWGYLAHEAAHVRFTSFQDWAPKGALFNAIRNIVEDVRIENAIIVPYPGARSTLDAVMTWLVEHGLSAAPKEGDSSPEVLANALLHMARYRYRQQAFLKAEATEAERVLRKTFPPSFVHRLLGLMAEIPGLRNTGDTADLAERIVALVADEAQDPPPPESNEEAEEQEGGQDDPSEQDPTNTGGAGSSDDGAGGESDDGANEGAPTEEEGADESREQEPSEDGCAGEETDESEQEPADADGDGSRDDGAEGGSSDGRKALQAVLSAGEGDMPGDAFEAVAEALNIQCRGTPTALLPTLEQYAGHASMGKDALARVKSESAKLTTRLQSLVEAHTMAHVRTVRRGRVLSPSHLHRLAVGDTRVFQRQEQKIAPNTALHLLVDLSGSMRNGNDRIALDAAMTLTLALEPMRGVVCAVTAFPSLRGEDREVTRILSHGDRMAVRAGAFVQCARSNGGTPMTGALWYAAADLLARREERKVILSITDGSPDDWDSAKAMVERASDAGLEMIGVGIGVQVDRLFPIAIRIGSVVDLKSELFGIAERLLLK